ncbi:MAG: maleylacetoacetate isomerase [Pseudomonadota bacterium]|nr:maleylacetoacetate isomerase [Pseudomonadota bacterium]QKK04449.1 MAG: maleylacetoacetate isomerase [Pseudomonadota bacterium]
MLTLYNYFRSSTSYRVRIGLNYKKIPYQQKGVNLVKGEQWAEDYREMNPQGAVPVLVFEDGYVLTQSLAILDYLEESYPGPSIYPEGAKQRAFTRQIALIVSCDVHPVNNLRVLKYLTGKLGVSEEEKTKWYQKWIYDSMTSIEIMLNKSPYHTKGEYCCGSAPTLADMCLIPQIYNARRFNCDMSRFPLIEAVEKKCLEHPAFIEADPHSQPDTPAELRKAATA